MDLEIPHAVRPRPVPEGADLDDPTLYFSRELSWLDFNRRVFAQALDEDVPLLERVRFLAITSSNLDEFVQKRVGGLHRQVAAHVTRRFADGRIPSGLVGLVRDGVRRMQAAMDRAWTHVLKPQLEERAGVRILSFEELSTDQRDSLKAHFEEHLYPIVTPMVVDPGHPFPFISNLSLSLAIEMRDARGALHFARLKVPLRTGRWLPVPRPEGRHDYVAVEEVVRAHVQTLFPGLTVQHVHAFRVTRNADVERDEEEAEDLIEMISEELRERRLAPVVRLEVGRAMPEHLRALLLAELELAAEDLVEVEGELGLDSCHDLADLELPAHRFEPWEPVVPARLSGDGSDDEVSDRGIFAAIRRGDILVHHPYESFAASVQRLVSEAALDPSVLAIKQTLYRTSENSAIVEALLRAAARGKQVAVMVEVKARFDEQNNIEWARILETAGVHVTYGVLGLKTHAKALLIIREEDGHPRTYCHMGTGFYHAGNARVYTDLGLLTADPEIGADLVALFHSVTGHAPAQTYEHLVVAPAAMRRTFVELIEREIDHARGGRGGRIVAKMNALDDEKIIRHLYRASRAGVEIELVVRGHCSLRPGIPGFSERIRVVSIIGRFLEHDRIFLFHNDGDLDIYIGSADWRRRNFDSRVEALVQVLADEPRARIRRILDLALADNVLSWELGPSGAYVRRRPSAGEPVRDLHAELMADTLARAGAVPPDGEIKLVG